MTQWRWSEAPTAQRLSSDLTRITGLRAELWWIEWRTLRGPDYSSVTPIWRLHRWRGFRSSLGDYPLLPTSRAEELGASCF